MPKQTITIDVDIPADVAAKYEVESVRPAKHGETVMSADGTVETWTPLGSSTAYMFILRRRWVPPKWLPEGCWVYRHVDVWWVSVDEPEPCCDGYMALPCWPLTRKADSISPLFGNFTPPPVDKIQVKHA